MIKREYKNNIEFIMFLIIVLFYLTIALIYFFQTTIFYDINNTYNVLLDTDTGPLFYMNIFAITLDNPKHMLFMQIISLVAFPVYIISKVIEKFGFNFTNTYGLGLIIIQILVSSISIVLIFNILKRLNIGKITLYLLITLLTISFPQLFMSLNIERFIYAQLTLILFIFTISKIKNQNSYIVDLIAVSLIGITMTNIYLYFANILLEFKFNIRKILKHLLVFISALYILIVLTKAYSNILLLLSKINKDLIYIVSISMMKKINLILTRLIYTTLYFPSYEIVDNKLQQNSLVNKVFLILVLIVLIIAIIGGIKNIREKLTKLCLVILITNIIFHGIIGYNLLNANIMTIHFSFSIIILLAYFSKELNNKQLKGFNVFLVIVISTVILSNVLGFREILRLGVSVYPK